VDVQKAMVKEEKAALTVLLAKAKQDAADAKKKAEEDKKRSAKKAKWSMHTATISIFILQCRWIRFPDRGSLALFVCFCHSAAFNGRIL